MNTPPSEPRTTFGRLSGAGRPVRWAIGLIFVVSLGIRLLLALVAEPVFVSDARDYRVLARNLADGRGYVQVYAGETQAFQGFEFRAFRPPGYPVFLVALHALTGWNDYAYLFANIAADLATQACGLVLAARLLGVGPAVFVQALLAAHVLWTPNPMTEALHTALFTALVLLILQGRPWTTWGGATAFGLLAAGALFVRPVTICVYAALLWRFLRARPTTRGALLVAVALLPGAAGVSAWAARNYSLFGVFVPFTTNLGHHNAWDYGLNADLEFARLRAAGLNEGQINAELLRLERARAARHPLPWLVTCAERAAGLFSLAPAWEVREVLWKHILPPTGSWVGRAYRAAYAQYTVTYVLAAAGALALLLQRRDLRGLWEVMLLYVVVHALLSRGDIRLAAPLYPLLCLLAGEIWRLASNVRRLVARRPRRTRS